MGLVKMALYGAVAGGATALAMNAVDAGIKNRDKIATGVKNTLGNLKTKTTASEVVEDEATETAAVEE